MLNMRIDSMVAAIVRQEMYGKGRDKEALHFHFDLGISSYNGGTTFAERRGLHLLYQVNEGHTYINVFSAVTPSPFTKLKDVESWTHEATHDICWRDIGVFSSTYFDMAKGINAQRVKKGMLEIAPASMSEHNFILAGNNFYNWVPACVTKDPTDPNNHKRLIQIL